MCEQSRERLHTVALQNQFCRLASPSQFILPRLWFSQVDVYLFLRKKKVKYLGLEMIEKQVDRCWYWILIYHSVFLLLKIACLFYCTSEKLFIGALFTWRHLSLTLMLLMSASIIPLLQQELRLVGLDVCKLLL